MGISERKQRQKEALKSSIIQAAWDLVEREGPQALSIRKIADAIEYSVPVIYEHYENKDAILLELTKMGFRLLNQNLIKARDLFKNPEQQVEVIAHSYWDFAFTHKQYYKVMFGLGLPSCETVKQIPELTTFAELVMKPLTEIIGKGNNTSADPNLKFQTLWSTLHGLVSINMMGMESNREEFNALVLKDFITSYIAGMKG
jgi:AcrR family transcriptional regulator